MKLKKTDVKNIFIWSRGKNRDIYGNPYYSYVCRINLTDGSKITFSCPMSWGSSGAYDVFVKVSQKLSVKFGIHLTYDDVRSGFVIQNHKQVKTESALEHPERWRLAQINAI